MLEAIETLLRKQPIHRSKTEIETLVHLTQELPFFKLRQENGQLIHRECCKNMFLEKYQAGEIVFHVDSIGTKFYVIFDGEVEVLIKRRGYDEMESVRILKKGESFGELALIHRQPRLATIKCVSDCLFAVLEKQQFQQILHYEQTQKIEQNVDYFSQIPILHSLNRTQLTQIYLNSFLYDYEKNQLVVQEGDKSDSFIIIKSGVFQVRKQLNKIHPLIIFEISEQQVFGFYHLYNKVPYEYSLTCLSAKGSVYKIHRNSIIEKIFEIHSNDLNKNMQEINNYATFKVTQEQQTQQKFPKYFQIKTLSEQENNDVKIKKQQNLINHRSRNSLIKQKMDNMIEQQKRKQNQQQLVPKISSLFEIFLKSHKGLTESTHSFRVKSPSQLDTPNRIFGSSSHFFYFDEQNPFITYRSGSPTLPTPNPPTHILKQTSSQRMIHKGKINKNPFEQQYFKNISLSPNIIKMKVHKN